MIQQSSTINNQESQTLSINEKVDIDLDESISSNNLQ
jgi:hypothetical protein